jgi:hypothetical protein
MRAAIAQELQDCGSFSVFEWWHQPIQNEEDLIGSVFLSGCDLG